jgi:hypothetical protein
MAWHRRNENDVLAGTINENAPFSRCQAMKKVRIQDLTP